VALLLSHGAIIPRAVSLGKVKSLNGSRWGLNGGKAGLNGRRLIQAVRPTNQVMLTGKKISRREDGPRQSK